MKNNKDKRIKNLKKVHIWPHVILLMAFIIFFAVVIMTFSDIFFLFLIENHLDDSYARVETIADILEGQDDAIDENILAAIDKKDSEDIAIYDKNRQEYVVKAKNEINQQNSIEYEFDEHVVYFDYIDGEGVDRIQDGDSVGIMPIVLDSLGTTKFRQATDSGDLKTELFSIHGWIKQPVKSDDFILYYSTDVELEARDILYIIIFFATMVIMVSVPLILYIVTLIISVIGHKRSAKLIYYDAITGGNNWLYFKEKAGRIIKRNKRGKYQYVMVCLRMERYQGYCACYGAMEGEAVIERINQMLSKSVKKRKELFSRYAEAEFGLMLLMQNQAEVAERVKILRNNLIRMMDPRKIDFSIGLCEVTTNGFVDELYGNASLARKTISVNATEKVCWFNEKLKEEQRWERFVEENMEQALNNGELHVYLQPKYNAGTKRLGGAEALIRWISPTEGFIGPGKFIPIFEKNGFITKIDDFMISSVAKLQAQWVKEGQNVVPISVNVSRAHFTQEDLAEHICKIVDDVGAPKELIELELTESAFFEDKDILINTVEKLKGMGFSISMDDFGAGYSSLNSLKDLQLDVLKIDADFFRGREENEERGSMIVSETIHLAKNLGMTTVAEGIESAEQVEFLAQNGCDLIQGFYFAKPMPVEDYVKKMEEDKALI